MSSRYPEIPQINIVCPTISTTAVEAVTFRLFIASENPTAPVASKSAAPSSAWTARSYLRAEAPTRSANCCAEAATSASRSAPGEVTPGCLRAAARTYLRAFSTAASAIPNHTELQTTCETGSIVWVEISEYGTPATISGVEVARRM